MIVVSHDKYDQSELSADSTNGNAAHDHVTSISFNHASARIMQLTTPTYSDPDPELW